MLTAWNAVKSALIDLEAAIRAVTARVKETCLEAPEDKKRLEKK
jgi:hypothetical protein